MVRSRGPRVASGPGGPRRSHGGRCPMRKLLAASLLGALLLMTRNDPSPADEGMWLFNNPPRELLKQRYGFEPTKEWLEHVQKSSVRFNTGGSGSFVSG